MKPGIFRPSAPGKLIPTVVLDRVIRNGRFDSQRKECMAFIPDPLPPRTVDPERFKAEMFDSVLEAHSNLLRLEGVVASLPNPNVLLSALRKREVRRSSEIENTVASIAEVAQLDAGMPPAREEVIEVRNNIRAIEHAIASPLPMSNRLMREAHAILLEGTRGKNKTPGEFRTGQVYIGDEDAGAEHARFIPPPGGEVLQESLDQFERYLNPVGDGARPRMHYLIELALAHYQFEAIHPFNDGNGRLGRLLVNVWPVKSGDLRFPLANVSEFFAENKHQYYDSLLAVSTEGNWLGWAKLFCKAVARQSGEDHFRARALADLREEYFLRFGDKRTSVKSHELIDRFFERPYLNAGMVSLLLNVTAPTAQKHLDALIAASVIREVTGAKTNRVYAATEILRMIDAPIQEIDPSRVHKA